MASKIFGGHEVDVNDDTNADGEETLTIEESSEIRALRFEVERLRARLAHEAAYRAELEAVLSSAGPTSGPSETESSLSQDAFERFINAADPDHEDDRDFLLG